MEKNLPIEAIRFKSVREELNHTQSSFAELLGIKNIIADIERGKTKITGMLVMQLLKQFSINPMWLYGESDKKVLTGKGVNTIPKVITLDSTESENILMVNQKAAAGYPQNIMDNSWYEALPAFGIPLPEYKNATYRAFQVEGDSMYPVLKPGEWLLCKAMEEFSHVRHGKIYVVVLQDSVLVKKIESKEEEDIKLISINREYDPIEVDNSDVMEVWEVSSRISFDIDSNITMENGISGIFDSISDLKKEIVSIKSKL